MYFVVVQLSVNKGFIIEAKCRQNNFGFDHQTWYTFFLARRDECPESCRRARAQKL